MYQVVETSAKVETNKGTAPDNGTELLKADKNASATSTSGVFRLVNTLPTVDIPVDKTWFQADGTTDINGTIRNASVTIRLKVGEDYVLADASGTAIEAVTLDGSETEPWTYTWSNLPKYDDNGAEIEYKVVETSAKIETDREDGGRELIETGTVINANLNEGTHHLVNKLPKTSFDILKVKADGM